MKAGLLWLALLGLSLPVLAHEGEAHAEAAPPVGVGAAGELHVLGATGAVFEVVLKHPEHAVGAKTPVRLYVAEATTNAPVSGAKVELALSGAGTQALSPRMESPGIYVAEAELAPGAEWAAVATVTKGDTVDVLALGTVHVEPEKDEAEGQGAGMRRPVALLGAGASALLVATAAAWALRRKRAHP